MQDQTTDNEHVVVHWVEAPRSNMKHLAPPDGQLTLCGLIPLFRSRWMPPPAVCRVCLRHVDRRGLVIR